MTKTKSTKSALMLSALAILLCVSMLVGSTFAWFTDSVASENNIIKSGNLDVVLEYWDGDSWENVQDSSKVLTNELFEPGVTEVAYLRVSNAGSLAFKYQLGINVLSEKKGVNQAGKTFNLSDYIVFGVVEGVNGADATAAYTKDDAGRAKAIAAVTDAKKISVGYTKASSMEAGSAPLYLALVVYMPTSVDNVANHNGTDVPQIDLGINLFATQQMAEEDSFGSDYDSEAVYQVFVDTADDLQAAVDAAVPGTEIILNESIVLDAPIVIPAAQATFSMRSTPAPIVIDLNGKTITADGSTYAFNNLGNLILTDSVGSGFVKARGIYNGYGQGGENVSSAYLFVNNVTINALGTNGGAAIYNYGIVEIKNSEFSSIGGYALNNQVGGKMTLSNSNATGGIYNMGELTVNNSTVYQHISGRHAIYNWSGSVVINGGQYDSISGNELILADGEGASVVINGGTFDKTAKSWLFGAATGKNITFVINGGTFNGYVNLPENTVDTIRPNNDPIVVYGGTFNFNPTKWIAKGYEVTNNGNGTWVVSEIKDILVSTFDELKAAIAAGGKFKLANNIEVSETIAVNAETVLNLNGYNITAGYQAGSTTKHLYPFDVYGTLTIMGDGSISGRGIFVQEGSKLILEGGSIYGIDSNGGSAIYQYGGDVIVNGGHIEQKAEGTYNFAINGLGGTVTVNGGWIGGNHGAIATESASVIINGGELVCTGTSGLTDNVLYSYSNGSIVINGGNFTADNDGPSGGCCIYDANGKVTVNGGTFGNSSGGDVWGTTGTTIKGGTFENLIEKGHIADGYEAVSNADGSVTITKK